MMKPDEAKALLEAVKMIDTDLNWVRITCDYTSEKIEKLQSNLNRLKKVLKEKE